MPAARRNPPATTRPAAPRARGWPCPWPALRLAGFALGWLCTWLALDPDRLWTLAGSALGWLWTLAGSALGWLCVWSALHVVGLHSQPTLGFACPRVVVAVVRWAARRAAPLGGRALTGGDAPAVHLRPELVDGPPADGVARGRWRAGGALHRVRVQLLRRPLPAGHPARTRTRAHPPRPRAATALRDHRSAPLVPAPNACCRHYRAASPTAVLRRHRLPLLRASAAGQAAA
eukprot:1086841-Prymnesium_polylepis.1